LNTRINLTGRNSNDIYTVSYPKNLLYFMKYDFNLFMERCVDLCKLYMKTGEYRQEEAAEIRNSISGCHKYFEQNLRGAFEKIVIDCWVEYICRQNEIGVITLWNNYIPCRNDFEKAVFMRLSEYRHGHAINQWVNILKVQEYANVKVDFIFEGKLKNSAEAAARANYFDLMFNVVANELGYDLNFATENKVFSMGRTPNSPFIMSSVSREIVRNLLTDLRYGDDKGKSKKVKSEIVSDQTAMDAFSSMKLFLPPRGDNIVETMIKSLMETPLKVYMPTSLKAAIDLEIDVIIENEAYLQRCELCREYYMRSEEFDFDYCDKLSKNGRSCREVMLKKTGKEKRLPANLNTESVDTALLNERCDRLYKEMSARINVEFTQRDFSDWCKYMNTIRDNIQNGLATMRDFENFAEYSRTMSFLPGSEEGKRRTEEKERGREKDEKGRDVKPFVFERVDRRVLEKPESKKNVEVYNDSEDEEPPVVPVASRVSAKVIRGMGPEPYSSGVVIPHTNTEPHGQSPQPRQLKVQPQKPADNLNTGNNLNSTNDEEVRIYNVKSKETPEREEYVKVFNPKKMPKKVSPKPPAPPARIINPFINGRVSDPIINEPASPPVSVSKRGTANDVRQPVPEKPRVPAFITPPPASVPALSVPKSENQPRQNEKSRADYSTPRVYASQKAEETQEIGFTDILRGFERKDGFADENIPTDSDGVPVSHKTKRVMDAIFKQSKPSLFINLNKGDE